MKTGASLGVSGRAGRPAKDIHTPHIDLIPILDPIPIERTQNQQERKY
jgi:hypothetical protein